MIPANSISLQSEGRGGEGESVPRDEPSIRATQHYSAGVNSALTSQTLAASPKAAGIAAESLRHLKLAVTGTAIAGDSRFALFHSRVSTARFHEPDMHSVASRRCALTSRSALHCGRLRGGAFLSSGDLPCSQGQRRAGVGRRQVCIAAVPCALHTEAALL
jgi:hypothetical protein